jgi:hypothetical protein
MAPSIYEDNSEFMHYNLQSKYVEPISHPNTSNAYMDNHYSSRVIAMDSFKNHNNYLRNSIDDKVNTTQLNLSRQDQSNIVRKVTEFYPRTYTANLEDKFYHKKVA